MVSSGGGPGADFAGGAPHSDADAALRVGIFGGTFDPPHIGHGIVATEVADALQLDRLLWVPASTPPHKTGRVITPGSARRRLVAAMIAGDPRFELCDLELERGGVSYTVDTLRRLRTDHPRWSMFLLLGMDLMAGFARWKEHEAILELAELAVIGRAGVPEEPVRPAAGSGERTLPRFRTVRVTPADISSARVRQRIRRKLSVRGMVAPPVLAVIQREGLYGA